LVATAAEKRLKLPAQLPPVFCGCRVYFGKNNRECWQLKSLAYTEKPHPSPTWGGALGAIVAEGSC